MAARLGVIGLLLALVVRAGAGRHRPHRRFFVELLPAAVAAQLLDGLASDLPASLLIELELLGANMHSAQCLRERVAHQFGVGHFASLNSQQNKNETARVLPQSMAVSKSLDKGLANCLWSLPLSSIKFIVAGPATSCPHGQSRSPPRT